MPCLEAWHFSAVGTLHSVSVSVCVCVCLCVHSCKKMTRAQKRFTVHRLPNVLTIQLKR